MTGRKLSPLLIVAALAIGTPLAQARGPLPPAPGSRVFVVSVGGTTVADLRSSRSPAFQRLFADGASANIAVRVSNHPADAMATLGAAERVQTHPSAGWAFDVTETVENGPAVHMYARRVGRGTKNQIVIPAQPQIVRANAGQAFGGRIGTLADALTSYGIGTAAVGNADLSAGPLPRILPDQAVMTLDDPPETGIHREISLAVTGSDGTVPLGDVSRATLERSPSSPFGVRANRTAILAVVDRVLPSASLIAIESGDTYRADLAGKGRSDAIARAGELIAGVMQRMSEKDLLIVVSPTTPGGPDARGRLRPVLLFGDGVRQGLLRSDSTKKTGLITMPDLSATIAHRLGASGPRLGSGRAVEVVPGSPAALIERDRRAATHDLMRPWWSLVACIAMGAALLRAARGGAGWVVTAASAIPLASYLTIITWPWGPWISGAAALGAAGALGWIGDRALRRRGPVAVAAVTLAMLTVDLVMGGRFQLDTLLGYTSVAAGRYYGLGNLGFAVMLVSTVIVATTVAQHRSGRPAAAVVLAASLVLMGLPQFGNDVGGTLAATVAFSGLTIALATGRPMRLKHLALGAAASVALVVVIGLLDMSRGPASRTHLGDLFANIASDPSQLWLVVRRKVILAVTIGVRNPWAFLLVPALIAHRKAPAGSAVAQAGTQAAFIGAIVGSAVNDSGLAVGGLVLALWTLGRFAPSSGPKGDRPMEPSASG